MLNFCLVCISLKAPQFNIMQLLICFLSLLSYISHMTEDSYTVAKYLIDRFAEADFVIIYISLESFSSKMKSNNSLFCSLCL